MLVPQTSLCGHGVRQEDQSVREEKKGFAEEARGRGQKKSSGIRRRRRGFSLLLQGEQGGLDV